MIVGPLIHVIVPPHQCLPRQKELFIFHDDLYLHKYVELSIHDDWEDNMY